MRKATKAAAPKLVYDQRLLCDTGCCPVLERKGGTLVLYDPAKPQQGSYTFGSEAEYNTFLANAPKV